MCCDRSNDTVDKNFTITFPNYIEHNMYDNPEDFLSLQTVTVIEKITHCGFVNCFFLIGAPVNLLTMIVFWRQGLRDRMNLCLFCLALIDLLYLTTLFTMVSYCFIGIAFPDQEEFWKWFFTKHGINCIYSFGISSGCVTMIIAVERCVCVMFPMKAATLISTKTMAIILLVTFITIQLLCSVYIIKEKITVVKDVLTGQTIIFLTNTELYLSNNAFKIVENIVLTFISFLNFIVVFLTTAFTLIGLRNAMAWRTSSASSDVKGQAVLMRMLVVVSSLYILCTAPNIILALSRFVEPEFRAGGRYSNFFMATHAICQLPVMFNSSVNFFVFAKMSSRFQHVLKTLCLCMRTSVSSRSSLAIINHSKEKHLITPELL